MEAVIDVGWAEVVEGLERVGKKYELASLQDWEPVQMSQMWGDVCLSWEISDYSGDCVLDCLESVEQVGGDPYVECVAVVQSAGDEGLCNGASGVLREPLENLVQQL